MLMIIPASMLVGTSLTSALSGLGNEVIVSMPLRAMCLSRLVIASLVHTVAHIVPVSPQEQMSWIDARRVIASVENLKSFWNVLTEVGKCEAMCPHGPR